MSNEIEDTRPGTTRRTLLNHAWSRHREVVTAPHQTGQRGSRLGRDRNAGEGAALEVTLGCRRFSSDSGQLARGTWAALGAGWIFDRGRARMVSTMPRSGHGEGLRGGDGGDNQRHGAVCPPPSEGAVEEKPCERE